MGSISIIYDTNTFISAYGFGGTPEDAVKVGFYDDVDVYVSAPILREYEQVLGYEHLPFTTTEQAVLVNEFRELTDAIKRSVPVQIEAVEDDPDDDKFLELAVATDTDYIVSGDTHLKEIGVFEIDTASGGPTEILPSHEFLDAIEKEPPESSLRQSD